MKRFLTGSVLALVLCAGVVAQEPSIAWEADLDLALKAAKEDGKPIMIAFIMDQEESNDEVAKTHFHDKDVVANSKNFHCLIAAMGNHAAAPAGICPRFGCNPCASHMRIQALAQEAYLKSTEISAPQFIFLKPDGTTMLVRHVWMLTPAELVKKMRLALGFSDPSKATEPEKQTGEEVTHALEAANDNNMTKRVDALQKLAKYDDPRIIEFLIKQTGDSIDGPRRLEAIDAMGTKGNAKALPVLVKLLASSSVQIRNHVVVSLENLAMPEAAPAIRAALKTEQKDNVRSNLVRALIVCDPKTPDHTKIVVGMIDRGTPKERIAAIRASFQLALSDSLKKSLLGAAKDATLPIRAAGFCALAKHQVKEAIPILEKAIPQEKMQDAKKLIQGALSILTQAAYEGPSPVDLLNALVTDDRMR